MARSLCTLMQAVARRLAWVSFSLRLQLLALPALLTSFFTMAAHSRCLLDCSCSPALSGPLSTRAGRPRPRPFSNLFTSRGVSAVAKSDVNNWSLLFFRFRCFFIREWR